MWNSEGISPVTVRVLGVAMTGDEPAIGSAESGFWVTDGMEFSLSGPNGAVLARVKATVRCGSSGPWWPLDPGNEWTFRTRDRSQTGGHAVWRIARIERINGKDWAVFNPGPPQVERVRSEPDGRIYRLRNDGIEELLIDPNGAEIGAWQITGRLGPADTLAGSFGEQVAWTERVFSLIQSSGRLARGAGPVAFGTSVIAGSSGGFGSGYELLEALIQGVRYAPSYARLELLVETPVADISGRKARNCAVPCYFVACGLVPGADPPGTYKPCMEASVRGGTAQLRLIDPSGTTVFETAAEGWVRIPLYRPGPVDLPAGNYTVTATTAVATVTAPLVIR